MATTEGVRRFYARLTAANAGVNDPRIIEAFAAIERERFVGPGPWQVMVAGGYITTDTDDPVVLYQDVVVGLIPQQGVNNGEPTLHAKSVAAAAPKVGDAVVHIGAGTGYYTAILAYVVGGGGRVYAYEMNAELARRAASNLAGFGHVTVSAQSAFETPLPAADVIYVSAGATHVPSPLLDALNLGGRLVIPLTPSERLGCMLLVERRSGNRHGARVFSTAGFIHCMGARDETQSRVLADALDSRSVEDVRSLCRGIDPDETAWCVGDGWWLSTAEPF